uniref:40S ribosomal protein S11-like n=1 Tax=Arvicanthis niloticus TaxID=61156 RepID=UPI001486153A|nr:40S ribosomal protein S11-like [Arvicanthis niloticus]
MADIQMEHAYQKQPTIFQNKKRVLRGETDEEKLPRYYKNIGLGSKTSKEAIAGTYIDKKCPFTSNVSIRGRILSGIVTKMKMQRTIVIRRDYLHYIRKCNGFEKRHKSMSVHLSPFQGCTDQIGDSVTVGDCGPLSKTVRFNVLKVTKAAGTSFSSSKGTLANALEQINCRETFISAAPKRKLVAPYPATDTDFSRLSGLCRAEWRRGGRRDL